MWFAQDLQDMASKDIWIWIKVYAPKPLCYIFIFIVLWFPFIFKCLNPLKHTHTQKKQNKTSFLVKPQADSDYVIL